MQDDTKDTKGENVVNNNKLSFPSWFHEECLREDIFKDQPTALAHLLNSSRQDVYSALSLYQIPVRYATTLIISILTIIGVLFSILGRIDVSSNVMQNMEIGAGLILLFAGIIGFISAFVITQYYKVYVSALLYATQMHSAVEMDGFYWFKRLKKSLSDENKKKQEKKKQEISKAEFIQLRTLSRKDSNFWYTTFLIVIGILSIVLGSFLLISAPFSNGSV